MSTVHPSGSGTGTVGSSYRYSPDTGEVYEAVQAGNAADVYAAYLAAKVPTSRLESLEYSNSNGRATLITRFGPTDAADEVEELYGVDVLKDIRTAAYFSAMSDAQVAAVTKAVDDADDPDGAWSALQLTLYKHMMHGETSYILTQFILRRTLVRQRTSQVRASFSNINEVVTGINLSANMRNLILSLPAGEWLKKPPQAEYLGRGRWRVTEEYHWAEKWSVLYGGTLTYA